MKHPLYDTWLFNAENLTAEQAEALKLHLSDCADCRSLFDAWRAVEGRMLAAELVAPEPGFTSRWQLRLEQALARRNRRPCRMRQIRCSIENQHRTAFAQNSDRFPRSLHQQDVSGT